MNVRFCMPLLALLYPSAALAQRDAPVWHCFLPSIEVDCPSRTSDLRIDLVFDKSGGPVEHTEHQMYLLSYLKKNEDEILEVSKDLALLDKKAVGDKKQFFDVLLERGLVAVIETQVAPRHVTRGLGPQDSYNREDMERSGDFDFSFSITRQKLFESLGKLRNFDANRLRPDDCFEDDIKLMVFVPVNDSKYATEVKEGVKGEHDFANGGGRDDANGNPLAWSTPILYFRPLPYEFQLHRLIEGEDAGMLLLHIN
jgi:hypothetical protein